MTDDKKFYADLGELFFMARVNRHMSVDAMSRITNIDPARYHSIERGDAPTAREVLSIFIALQGK